MNRAAASTLSSHLICAASANSHCLHHRNRPTLAVVAITTHTRIHSLSLSLSSACGTRATWTFTGEHQPKQVPPHQPDRRIWHLTPHSLSVHSPIAKPRNYTECTQTRPPLCDHRLTAAAQSPRRQLLDTCVPTPRRAAAGRLSSSKTLHGCPAHTAGASKAYLKEIVSDRPHSMSMQRLLLSQVCVDDFVILNYHVGLCARLRTAQQ